MSSRATLSEVAARAGVSKATASKVLNGRPGVAEATRKAVREAIAALDLSETANVWEKATIAEGLTYWEVSKLHTLK
ncbi:hypothetical protein ADL26_08325, partial [Thermoactinomyces vulgaris]